MALENLELIRALHLNEKTNDPFLALRFLSSGAPMPLTLMDRLDRYERRAEK